MPCNVLVRCIFCIIFNIANNLLKLMCVYFTCVTHVIVVGRALVCGDTTGIADSSRILAHFGLRHWCSVGAQISGFHGWRGLLKKMRAEVIKIFIRRDMLEKRVWTIILPGMDHRRSPSHSPPWRRGTIPKCGPSHVSWCFDAPVCQSRKGSEPYHLKRDTNSGIKLAKNTFCRGKKSSKAYFIDKLINVRLVLSHFWLSHKKKNRASIVDFFGSLSSKVVWCFLVTFMASSLTFARHFVWSLRRCGCL